MSVVFVKTPKGADELVKRGGGLTRRERRILILLDGKRSVESIRAMALADDLARALGVLEESGYIVLAESPRAALPPDDGPAPGAGFREIPGEPDPKSLEMARNFIMNTLKTFCGPLTHLSIVEAAFAARTHAELREQFVPWFEAITETGAGRRRAEELRAQLLKVI